MKRDGRVSAVTLSGGVADVVTARRWIDAFLTSADVSRACIDDAVLIVSELTSNAVRHGAGWVVCQAALIERSRCLVSVIDFGDGEPGIVDRGIVDVGGLGLVIVDRLAHEWGVAPFDGGKAVFAVLGADVGPGDAQVDGDRRRARG